MDGLLVQSIPIVEEARTLDDAVQRFSKLVIESSAAQTTDDYDLAYEAAAEAWDTVQASVKRVTQHLAETNKSSLAASAGEIPLEELAAALDDRFLELDATKLNLLELRSAEQRIFSELQRELQVMRTQALQIRQVAGSHLQKTFRGLVADEAVDKQDIRTLINQDFEQFKNSLEIDVTLVEILNDLTGVLFLNTADKVLARQASFSINFETLRTSVSAMDSSDPATAAILERLELWGIGRSNIFEQRTKLIDIERTLAEESQLFIDAATEMEVASLRLTGLVVDATGVTIQTISQSVEESQEITIGVLVAALLLAIFVGWRIVLVGIVFPIQRVETAMRRISTGETDVPMPPQTKDELGNMVGALHRLKDYVERVVVAERQVRESGVQLKQKTNLLEGALSNLNQGVVAFDKDLRLIIANQRYLEIRGYPSNMVFEGQSFEELMLFDAEREEFGEGDPEQVVQQWIAKARRSEEHHFERQRPNGRYIEVRGGGLPEGGFVSTFADITDRKTNEEALGSAHRLITDSIAYASRIQRAILAPERRLAEMFADHFMIWQPRDVVGGDIVWIRSSLDGGHPLVFVVDCTGHGVPGAFMTMIAYGALDQVLGEVRDGSPSKMLSVLHRQIKTALGQVGTDGESDDGLDIGVCRLRLEEGRVDFAGAKFSLWGLPASGDPVEWKGDRAAIGYRRYPLEQSFTEHSVAFAAGDQFYLWSDGVIDQVGGSRRRSFGKRRLVSLLT
ncbi:MAG: PAS-domain containing protein, partial [Rhodospirillaceae bacterium]